MKKGRQNKFPLPCAASLTLLFSACSSLLYYPTRELHFPPERFGLHPEEVRFRSGDGTPLFGWLFRHGAPDPTAPPKGVILFYHGNGENLSSHYVSLIWILQQGYDFFIFDYRGYGRSEGEPSPQGAVQDGEAALRWLWQRYPQRPLVLLGQSLGGAVALRNAIDLKGEIPYSAVAIDSSFASYQEIGRRVMAKAIFTWPLQWLPYLVLSDRYAPDGEISRIAPRALLVIHAEKDETVPFPCGEGIYSQAGPPRDFWKIPGGGHTDAFVRHGDLYRRKFLEWLERNARPEIGP
jgi:fermentation-respiration switch protein FrsA (DUF1100 family)